MAESDQQILMRNYPALRRFAAVVAPSEIEPEDLLQDTLVRVLRRGPLTTLDHPVAYIRRVMVNEASNRRRSLSRGRRAALRLVGGSSQEAPGGYPSDLSVLDGLDPLARAVVFLHEIEGYPFAHIAVQLHIEEPTARTIASRARRKLRTELESDR